MWNTGVPVVLPKLIFVQYYPIVSRRLSKDRTFSKGTSFSLPEDGVYGIPSCRLNVAANIHVPVIDSKEKCFKSVV